MWSPLVVVDEPDVEVGLQLLNRLVDLLAEGDPVELVEDGAMEALANTIGLRAFGLGAAVVDVLDGQIELVLVALGAAKTRCRDRSARATEGCRARRKTVPPDH